MSKNKAKGRTEQRIEAITKNKTEKRSNNKEQNKMKQENKNIYLASHNWHAEEAEHTCWRSKRSNAGRWKTEENTRKKAAENEKKRWNWNISILGHLKCSNCLKKEALEEFSPETLIVGTSPGYDHDPHAISLATATTAIAEGGSQGDGVALDPTTAMLFRYSYWQHRNSKL